MQEEFNSLQENETWELVPFPSKRKLVQSKWVYRTKFSANGSDIKYNSMLVSKFFPQFQRVDYTETFAPVAKMDSIRLVLAIATSKQWDVHHMDVKSGFIHGDIHEYIYMHHHGGFIHDPSIVFRLKKSLYGFKQAPRSWYAKMDNFLLLLGFERCKYDPNVYLQNLDDSF